MNNYMISEFAKNCLDVYCKFSELMVIWKWVEADGNFVARIPARDHNGDGFVIIYAIKRPDYCDRGKWHALVETEGIDALDGQEGFPRYYFRLGNLLEEMELWASERKCIKAANLREQSNLIKLP